MTIHIEYETEEELKLPYEEIITTVVNEALDYENCPYEAEVNVLLTDNEDIRQINKEYRDIDNATDVLSFPMADYDSPSDFDRLEDMASDYFNPETGELLLGDIVISVDKVKEQAEKYGHSETRELAFLVAHSMLHLCGYDHMVDEERLVMEKKQEERFKRMILQKQIVHNQKQKDNDRKNKQTFRIIHLYTWFPDVFIIFVT